MANAQIAEIYGVDFPQESGFARIDLDPEQRSGLLTLSGVLAYQADASQSNPIHRGVFINADLLCVDLPAPPDVVEPLPVLEEGQSNRERIELHTGEGTCGEACHATLINPPGFAFENYDAIGRYRTIDGAVTINASDSYYFDDERVSFQDGVEFSRIMSSSLRAHGCYTQKLTEFVLGRPLVHEDDDFLDEVAQRSIEGASIQELVMAIVLDPVFTNRGNDE